jgi:hypothetical protein
MALGAPPPDAAGDLNLSAVGTEFGEHLGGDGLGLGEWYAVGGAAHATTPPSIMRNDTTHTHGLAFHESAPLMDFQRSMYQSRAAPS